MFRETFRAKLALLMTPLLAAAGVPAQVVDFICTPAQAVECDLALECAPVVPELAPPTFFRVDLDERVTTILGPAERRGETTTIEYLHRDEDRVIVGGVEAGRGWSMSFSENGGAFTLTINLGDAGWVVVGQCIPADQLSL